MAEGLSRMTGNGQVRFARGVRKRDLSILPDKMYNYTLRSLS